MLLNQLLTPCPEHLEDEALIIETSGEMPEVALAESLLHLGHIEPEELACLRAATARGYLRLVRRDLDPKAVGKAHFRGLQRAGENLARLQGFLARTGWELDAASAEQLAGDLESYLTAEARALQAGRVYATCSPEQVAVLARALGLSLLPWQGLLERLASLACPDFRALTVLAKLDVPGAAFKRRGEEAGSFVVEVLDKPEGRVLARAVLPLLGPSEKEDPTNRERADLLWSLLPLSPV